MFAGNFGAVLGEDGVESALEAERQAQAQAQRDDEAGVAHEAEDACCCSGMMKNCLLVPLGQEINKQIQELLAFGNWPAESESSRAHVGAQIAGQVRDFLRPFVKGETAWATVILGDAKN